MKKGSKKPSGLSEADDVIDTAMTVIDEYVDEVMHRLKQRKDRHKFIVKLEEFCVNYPLPGSH